MANRVIVAVFGTENQAYDAAARMQRLDDDEIINLKRGAIATKDAKGNLTIPDSKHVGSAWGLLGGGLIGGLLGAMLGPVGVAAGAAASAAAAGAVVGAATGGTRKATPTTIRPSTSSTPIVAASQLASRAKRLTSGSSSS
jgi:uncharacterized membrane protein